MLIFNRLENPKYRKIKKFYTMNIFCLLSNYCFLVVLGDGVQFEILHFQMNFFSIPRILTPVELKRRGFFEAPDQSWNVAPQELSDSST